MFLWFLAKNVGIVFGSMYPAYQTFKALDSKDKEARAHMLRYWAVFAAFSSVEFYTDMLISWLPFYFELKMLILLYLSIPITKGSSTVYEMHMKPWLRSHQAEIDLAILQLKASMLAAVAGYRDRVAQWAHESMLAFLEAKIPALLPLYTMAIALGAETTKALFSQEKPVITEPILDSSSIDMASHQNSPPESTSLDTTTIVPQDSDFQSSAITRNHSSPFLVQQTALLIPQATTVRVPKSTEVPPTNSSSVPTQHKREAADPKTRGAKKLALRGTAMPVPKKPHPQPSTKKDTFVAIGEEDSIASMSPKRSNPKLAPVSPHRRSAV